MKNILTNDKIYCIYERNLYKVIYVTKNETLLLPEPVKNRDINVSIPSHKFYTIPHGTKEDLITIRVAEEL